MENVNNIKTEEDITYIHQIVYSIRRNIDYQVNILKQKEEFIKNKRYKLCKHTFVKYRDIYDSYHECSKCGDVK